MKYGINCFSLTDAYWSPYAVGIELVAWLSFLISGKPIATSSTFARISGMIENVITDETLMVEQTQRSMKIRERGFHQTI